MFGINLLPVLERIYCWLSSSQDRGVKSSALLLTPQYLFQFFILSISPTPPAISSQEIGFVFGRAALR